MAVDSRGWRKHLILAQIARSRAFKEYLALLRGLDFSSELPKRLISFFDSVNDAIMARMEALPDDANFQALRDDAAEAHMVRFSLLYQYLYSITSDLEHVETSRTIIEFASPLYRLILPHYGAVRVLLHALPEVNYSWADLVSPLLEIARELEVSIGVRPPARKLWSIGFPGLQPGQTLVHTLLAHELGHGIVQSARLIGSLRRQAKVDPSRLDALLRSAPRALPRRPLRQALRRLMRVVLTEWLDELACDVIGYDLAGPAFLFSSIHFLPALAELDSTSIEYPSVRQRLRLLFRLLKADLGLAIGQVSSEARYRDWLLEREAAGFLAEWDRHLHSVRPAYENNPFGVAAEAIDRTFDDLVQAIRRKASLEKYWYPGHLPQIRQLLGRLRLSVPPNELDDPAGAPAQLACTLNAGWIGYLCLIDDLCQAHGWDAWKARAKVEEWVAKALELQEVQRRWMEVR